MNTNYYLKSLNILLILVLFITFTGCPSIKDVVKTITNIKTLQFKLDRVSNFTLNRVNLSQKSSIKDFSIQEGLLLTQAFGSKTFPTTFDLVVLAKNPNTGVKESNGTPVTLNRMEWNLYIDNVQTISGVVEDDITVDPSNSTSEIPIKINIDMYKFFQDRGYDNLLNLMLSIGGLNSKPTKLMLDIKPEFKTKFGVLPFSSRIKVVDTEFR